MGNGFGRITDCLSDASSPHRRRRLRHHDLAVVVSEPCCYDEGLGHSFCYVRPEPSRLSSSKVHHHDHEESVPGSAPLAAAATITTTTTSTSTTTFKSISGASVSANTSTTPLSSSTTLSPFLLISDLSVAPAAAFDCSDSFSSVPLQPIPRFMSGPLSGPVERGFLSGPIERGFMSGPIDARSGIFSGPLDRASAAGLNRSLSHGGGSFSSFLRPRSRKVRFIRGLRRVIARTITRGHNAIVAPVKKELYLTEKGGTANLSAGEQRLDSADDGPDRSQNLQWAQGKAGEDRVHVVVSEEHGWVFVGIYDGFNGPDAPDYLLSNLYPAVQKELKGLLWEEEDNYYGSDTSSSSSLIPSPSQEESNAIDRPPPPVPVAAADESFKRRSTKNKRLRGPAKKWEENQRRWKCEWDRERRELDRNLKERLAASAATTTTGGANHAEVLKALSRALKKTEDTYLEAADSTVSENPELALMGSCVLAMLMKGEDVYLMNVGDSRAVLGQKPAAAADVWESVGKDRRDLARINEESSCCDEEMLEGMPALAAVQLSRDHSTCVEEEVQRIRREHPDDSSAVTNDRVKGSLKVTRAFGAGYLKQPKWNNALLEMFRIDYVGTSPYLTCTPSLLHHRLTSRDRFLLLSSDGLYQYFTNEEAVAEVELFIALFPEGDPAQHLVEEVLFRAAKNAGMEFHDLLEIPQGDRRRYHDDVSIIVISLEGRIWRSCV